MGALLAALVVAMAPTAVASATTASASVPLLPVREVQTVWTSEHGIAHPIGLAYDPTRRVFLVAGAGVEGTEVLRLGPDATDEGTVHVPQLRASTALAFDAPNDRLVWIDDGGRAAVRGRDLTGREASMQRTELPHVEGSAFRSAAFDSVDGTWTLLDANADVITRVSRTNVVTRLSLPDGTDAELIAANPEDGLLYLLSLAQGTISAVDGAGMVGEQFTLAGVEMNAPVAMTFAPSTDSTDDPARHNLFIADAGGARAGGGVTEVSLQAVMAAAVTTDTATLIRRTQTSEWSPGSPDPSGVAWLPGPDRLVVVDSEVDETTGAGWNDVNIWFTQRDGTVTDAGTAWGANAAVFDGRRGYSREPTGATFDATGNVLFVSDDNAGRVFVVRAGPDAVLGNADDVVSAIDTKAVGATDTEDLVFDPRSGHLFVLDGVGTEIYRVAPVDGVFGNGNDAVSHFDISHLGPADFEGLARDPVRGTFYVGARHSGEIFEIDDVGTHLRTIDTSGIAGLRFISGLEVAPSTTGSGGWSVFIVDRAIDNGADPNENDGKLFELAAPGVGVPPRVPGAPTDVAAVAGDGEVTVSWTAPSSDGGSAVTAYVVTPFVGAVAGVPIVIDSPATTHVVAGLTNGTGYSFAVAARNRAGTGPPSGPSAVVVPAGLPGAPTIGSASPSDRSASVSWTAPVSNGGTKITGYVVTPYLVSPTIRRGYYPLPSQTFASTATSQIVTGLTNGTSYRFRVRAFNAIGIGRISWASNAITPAPDEMTASRAPTIVSASPGDSSATVSWTAPSTDRGSPTMASVVTPHVDDAAQSPRCLQCRTPQVHNGSTNGTTYRFEVRAWNAVGIGTFPGTSNPARPSPTPVTEPAPLSLPVGTSSRGPGRRPRAPRSCTPMA